VNIVEMLTAQVAARPDAPAIIDCHGGASRTLSFADLDRQSRQGAALLRACGLRRGDGVLLFHPMSAELYVVLLSVFRLGLVAIVIDPSAGLKAIDRCCAACPPKGFFGGPRAHLLRLISGAIRRIPVQIVVGAGLPGATLWRRAQEMPACNDMEACAPDTPALVTLTGGGTGLPKAACRTHGFLLAQYRALLDVLDLVPGEVDLTTLPIVALANLASGVTTLIPDADLRAPGSIVPGPVLDQIEAHRATRTSASPALLERLADHCLANGRTIPRLEKVLTGGGPVFPDVLDKICRVAPNADPTAIYGSTEAEPIARVSASATSNEDRQAMLRGCGLLAGRPVPAVAVRILPDRSGTSIGSLSRERFDKECLPPGEPGEIVVSGAHVLTGYLHGRGDKETKFQVDDVCWHRTGDAGCLDRSGRLWLLGRCEAKVSDARGVLYPFAVESAARQHQNVLRVALTTDRDGRRVLAMQLRETRDPGADLRVVKESLAWAGVDSFRVYHRLPVDHRHNAKIDYGALGRLLDRPPVAAVD
jgi:acyl-CoA synthetase (AMP-forming)/AMP-acid ligase II